MRRTIRLIGIMVAIAIIGSALVGCGTEGAQKAESNGTNERPEVLLLGSHELGTGGHRELALVAEGIDEFYDDMTVRAVPTGTATGRLYLAREGDVYATTLDQPDYYFVNEGEQAFNEPNWGPQPIRSVFLTAFHGAIFGTRGDSGIEKIEDLKGKKFPQLPAQPGMSMTNRALLAFGGLTLDDVDVVEYSSSTAVYDAVVRGELPAAMMNVNSAAAYEGAELPGGWKWISMPASDTEGWERVRSVFPGQPREISYGASIDPNDPVTGMTYGFPTLVAYADTDENKTYWTTRAIIEARDAFKNKDQILEANWNAEQFMQLFENDFIPMHDGSVKYMKEIGLWTEEHDKMNKERIEYQEKMRELWDEAVEERIDKGIKGEDFNQYWIDKKQEAGLGLQYFRNK